MTAHERHGAKQPHRFDPAMAGALDDRARFEYLPPAEVFALLDAPLGSTVVDFGTGTGTYAIELVASRPDLRVVAFDEQRVMLDQLKAKLGTRPPSNLELVLAGGPSAHLIEATADRVLALNVLHELGDEALKGLLKLLKPTGWVLFIDWNAAAEGTVGPPRDHVYTPEEATERLRKSGFKPTGQRLFKYHYALWGR